MIFFFLRTKEKADPTFLESPFFIYFLSLGPCSSQREIHVCVCSLLINRSQRETRAPYLCDHFPTDGYLGYDCFAPSVCHFLHLPCPPSP